MEDRHWDREGGKARLRGIVRVTQESLLNYGLEQRGGRLTRNQKSHSRIRTTEEKNKIRGVGKAEVSDHDFNSFSHSGVEGSAHSESGRV